VNLENFKPSAWWNIKMKLEEGKAYGFGFPIFLILWFIFSNIISFSAIVQEPAFMGFSLVVILLVIYQLYSGVALDRAWNASISENKSKNLYYGILAGQTFVALFAFYTALNNS
jgi:hypothetical protein